MSFAFPRSLGVAAGLAVMGFAAGSATLALRADASPQNSASATTPTPRQARVVRPGGWNDATHGATVKPDYARLFSMDRVHELRITIPAASFKAMQEDLATIGPTGMMFGRGRGGDVVVAAPVEVARMAGPGGPGGAGVPGRGGAINLTSRDPMYVHATVTHDGRTWTDVGMRYKGNSSLVASIGSGNGKIGFRLDFDEYADAFAAIVGQRFYGFQKMTFSSNFGDDTQLREVLASEVMRDRGVPAARAAFYRIFVDGGNGSEYWGLYTMIEDPADGAMLDAQLGSRNGNLYKPEGVGANFTTFDEAGFGQKTNREKPDFSDVKGAVEALNAPATNAAAWRRNLEATFHVDGFLRWLAVNAVIENWDAYGVMPHNYYLYAAPGKALQWIPWDHNFAFGLMPGPAMFGRGGRGFRPPPGAGAPPAAGGVVALPPGGPGPNGPGGPGGAPFPPGGFGGRGGPGGFGGMFGGGPTGTDILAERAGDQWPLISKLMADDAYRARYRALLREAMNGLLEPAAFERRVRQLHALVAPFVVGPTGERPTHTTVSSADAFRSSLDGESGLITRVTKRQADVRAALAKGTTAP
jgi:spore coat protein H